MRNNQLSQSHGQGTCRLSTFLRQCYNLYKRLLSKTEQMKGKVFCLVQKLSIITPGSGERAKKKLEMQTHKCGAT